MGVIANNCEPKPVELLYETGFWLAVAVVLIVLVVGIIFICPLWFQMSPKSVCVSDRSDCRYGSSRPRRRFFRRV